jgi:hypothetical protein
VKLRKRGLAYRVGPCYIFHATPTEAVAQEEENVK